MENFDTQRGIEELAFVMGQALALLTVENPAKREALDELLIYHEANAANPSASLVIDRLRKGAEPMLAAMRDGRIRYDRTEK